MQRKYTYILFITIISLFLTGCSKVLDLKPSDSLSRDVVLSTTENAEVALTGSYALMESINYYGRNMFAVSDISGDDIYIAIQNSNRFISSYQRLYQRTDGDITGLWNSIYKIILSANNIINKIDAATGDADQKSLIKGQALFIRALAYFDLTRIFCKPYSQGNGTQLGVPLVFDFQQNSTPARKTLLEVYNQIIADLNLAKTLLINTDEKNKFTVSQFAAAALLSRVYLYKLDYANAITEATDVMNAGYTLTPITSLADFYANTGTGEEIFTLKFLAVQDNGSDNLGNMYLKQGGYGDFRVSPNVVAIFDKSNDERYKNFISRFSSSANEYQNNKFTGQDGIQGLYSPKILRLAEVILNRAEAYTKSNNFVQGLNDLNTIRTSRGLAALNTVPNDQLLDSVLVERRRELMFEGHRFFDLIRNNKTITKYQKAGVTLNVPFVTIPFNDFKVVAPIPQSEIDVNKNIIQNTGYF